MPMTPGDPSKLLALRRLRAKQEGLRVFPLATDLERTEVLPPEAVRSFRFRLSPQRQLIEVLRGDLSIAEAIEQGAGEGGGEVGPLVLRHPAPRVMRARSSCRLSPPSGWDPRGSRSARS